jgi:spoIIIJ-associated protein
MGNSERRYFAGRTLGQAVLAAAGHYGVEPEELAYRRVEKRHGFLKARRRVVIEVDPEEPRQLSWQEDAEPAADPVVSGVESMAEWDEWDEGGEEKGLYEEERRSEQSPLEEVAADAVEELIELAQLRLTAEVAQREGFLQVELKGPDRRRMWARHGELMRSIEHLMPRLLREKAGGTVHCRVDCDGFWKRRQEELRRLALKVAREVRDRGTSRLLQPLNPAERRVVHLAIADEIGVSTDSEGEGYLKRIRVRPWEEEVQDEEEAWSSEG